MAVDAWGFDAERQAKAHRLRRMRFRLSIVRSAAIIVLVVGLVAVGSASLRDAVASFRWPSWASTILFLVLLFLIFLAVELPFAYVGGHRWETTSGLSSQSFRGWAKDLAKSVGLGLGGSIVVGSVVLWLLSATPAWWWLVAWVLGVLVSAILGFLAPVLLVPLFYRFRPLADAALRRRFEALAVSWVYASTYTIVGIRSVADMAGLPFLVAVFSILALPFRPLELRASRSREARADRFSLALTGDPANFIAAMVKLHDLNLGVADPRPWEKWLFYSHPTGRDRVEMARAFRAPSA